MCDIPYLKPEERGRWESIRLGLYNPSTHEVLGRTCGSWGEYYAWRCHAALFTARRGAEPRPRLFRGCSRLGSEIAAVPYCNNS